MKIIIVEDELDVAIVEREILSPYADEIILITDHIDRALHADTWTGVDVAIVDLMLPDHPGEDICRFLIDNAPSARRVICTAKPTYQLPELQTLAHVVLQKPFSNEALIGAVIADGR